MYYILVTIHRGQSQVECHVSLQSEAHVICELSRGGEWKDQELENNV